MPCTFSIVLCSQNSGAISTRPPMETTRRMPTTSSSECRSSLECCFKRDIGTSGDRGDGSGRSVGLLGGGHLNRLPEVDDHDQGAGEVHQAANGADDVLDVLGRDGLDEAVR